MAGHLFVCATPIGNLGDASSRLATALAESEVIYAEDTRRTGTLLQALGVSRPMRSYFAGNEADRSGELEERLLSGATIALVTDAGTPAVSDPGYTAVRAAVAAGATVTAIPGPSAVTAALSVSGIPGERFVFEGFLPRAGKERSRRLAALSREERTIVLFAAPSRVVSDLSDLAQALGAGRPLMAGRELTKLHEELWRGTLAQARQHWESVEPRGEFVLVIAGRPAGELSVDDLVVVVEEARQQGLSLSEAVRRIAEDAEVSRRSLYEAVLKSRGDV